ncbi:hypothetical protein HYPGJ_20184 [Hyphomicrobium sp. GJ21]|jgi:hypothetical protein|uniref:hypothetical protein n=1 Tax=Hyphomicrobium sp. GJ21 TaxID=113574 RepID=UPI000622B92E|nr:hypothetical protein [Hyphomicrobium sp. GJ21]CEJ84249.1 hypothetical protein HYPGJ_20184 [Hyphomicrobium sp. GJ21]
MILMGISETRQESLPYGNLISRYVREIAMGVMTPRRRAVVPFGTFAMASHVGKKNGINRKIFCIIVVARPNRSLVNTK